MSDRCEHCTFNLQEVARISFNVLRIYWEAFASRDSSTLTYFITKLDFRFNFRFMCVLNTFNIEFRRTTFPSRGLCYLLKLNCSTIRGSCRIMHITCTSSQGFVWSVLSYDDVSFKPLKRHHVLVNLYTQPFFA